MRLAATSLTRLAAARYSSVRAAAAANPALSFSVLRQLLRANVSHAAASAATALMSRHH